MRALLQLIDCILPPDNDSFKTKYFLEKAMKPWRVAFTQHEYCGECFTEWQGTEYVCANCAASGTETLQYRGSKKDQSQKRMKQHYFITFDVIEQLQQLLKRKFDEVPLQFPSGSETQRLLKLRKINADRSNMEDIYDGERYKLDPLLGDKNQNNISFGMNTDGAAPFDSTSISMWPVYLNINELPPNERLVK